MKSTNLTVHDGIRYWVNVDRRCTRCRHKIRMGEKSERFFSKGRRTLARHVGECPIRRVTTEPLFGRCACFSCRERVRETLLADIRPSSYGTATREANLAAHGYAQSIRAVGETPELTQAHRAAIERLAEVVRR